MIEPRGLFGLVADTASILLDFDGPICSIFAGYSAPDVAAHLRSKITHEGIELPAEVRGEQDPLEILRWTTTLARPEVTREIEDHLRSAELHAADSARPTPYAREVIVAAAQAGRSVAIVSNNSSPAIEAYLKTHRLNVHVGTIVGRPYAEPGRMKPNPELLFEAAQTIGLEPRRCLFIGDSLTDIIAAGAAGMPVIGYANKPNKVDQLTREGASEVVTSMAPIAATLLALA